MRQRRSPSMAGADQRFEALSGLLEALASPVRLQILHAVRTPRPVAELRITAARTRKGEREGRVLARQTVSHHVVELERVGLVRRTPATRGGADAVVLDHARLFALVDEVRGLAKLRPILAETMGGETLTGPDTNQVRMPELPRLMVAYGRDDGTAFALSGRVGTVWTIGRSSSCDVSLDYDPFASSEHARIERKRGRYVIEDLGSRNGTWTDWDRLRRGEVRTLAPGSLVLVGRSLLVFQAAPPKQ